MAVLSLLLRVDNVWPLSIIEQPDFETNKTINDKRSFPKASILGNDCIILRILH